MVKTKDDLWGGGKNHWQKLGWRNKKKGGEIIIRRPRVGFWSKLSFEWISRALQYVYIYKRLELLTIGRWKTKPAMKNKKLGGEKKIFKQVGDDQRKPPWRNNLKTLRRCHLSSSLSSVHYCLSRNNCKNPKWEKRRICGRKKRAVFLKRLALHQPLIWGLFSASRIFWRISTFSAERVFFFWLFTSRLGGTWWACTWRHHRCRRRSSMWSSTSCRKQERSSSSR